MTVSTAETVFMMVAVIDLIGIFILFGVILYIAKNKTDLILSSLQNSRISTNLIVLWSRGPWGRIRMIGEVCGILWKPKHHIQRGLLSAQDIENFPPELKRQLLLTYKLMLFFGTVMMCLGLIAEFELI